MKPALLVYPGLGKTTLSKIDDRFTDIETKLFKDMDLKQYIGTNNYPNFRGQTIVNKNPEFPENLKKYVLERLKESKILLLVFKDDSINLLSSLNIDYDIVLPNQEKLKQLKKDYISRGDDAQYIEHTIKQRYEDTLKQAKLLNKQIFFLENNEYLSDFIQSMQ